MKSPAEAGLFDAIGDAGRYSPSLKVAFRNGP
mgnify:CR=1 FL=1